MLISKPFLCDNLTRDGFVAYKKDVRLYERSRIWRRVCRAFFVIRRKWSFDWCERRRRNCLATNWSWIFLQARTFDDTVEKVDPRQKIVSGIEYDRALDFEYFILLLHMCFLRNFALSNQYQISSIFSVFQFCEINRFSIKFNSWNNAKSEWPWNIKILKNWEMLET